MDVSVLLKIIFFVTLLTQTPYAEINNCEPSNCSLNSSEIRYPFQIQGFHPPHCGLPGFKLFCEQEKTITNFPNYGDLVVKSIFYDTKTINLIDPKNCVHEVFLNLNLSQTPFRYYHILKQYKYINCSSKIPSPLVQFIPCLSTDSTHDNYVYTVELSFPVPVYCKTMKIVGIPFSYSPYLSDNNFGLGLTWDSTGEDEKIKPWRMQTHFKEENGSRPGISQKPLLLPVRSLKQRVLDPKEGELVDDLSGKKGSFNRTSSKRFITNSRESRDGDFEGSKSEILEGKKEEDAVFSSPTSRISRNGNSEGLRSENLEGKMEENVVFRSPIPWRSRSGRMETKESEDDDSEWKLLESRSFKSLMPNPSSKKLSPLPSFSSESHAKNGEDVSRKKNFSSPPPAPPPSSIPKSVSNNLNSSIFIDEKISSEKVMRRSVRSVPLEKSGESVYEQQSRRTNPSPELSAKSVLTFRTNENLANHVKFPKNEKYELDEKVLIQPTDEESEVETEDDRFEGSSDNEETAVDDTVSDVGPDVDKKADEFIAKFREQIRLQRIESIRKLTIQHAGAGKA
ncbi:uncharacterized protein [Primulina huaijiensis]|uniref:uncharacterized protein n=1 Tax=Primulina huaijiensis TaxID=1492673 RepID=UPI003CC6EA83